MRNIGDIFKKIFADCMKNTTKYERNLTESLRFQTVWKFDPVPKFMKLLGKFCENCGSLENFLKPKHLAYKSASMREHFHVFAALWKEPAAPPAQFF